MAPKRFPILEINEALNERPQSLPATQLGLSARLHLLPRSCSTLRGVTRLCSTARLLALPGGGCALSCSPRS